MEESPKPKRRKTPQKYNPLWKDATRKKRQAGRRADLNQVAIKAGYETWDRLATAAIKGIYIEINRPIVTGSESTE